MIFGLVLAGGRSRRFGGDKALAALDGRSLLEASLAALGHDSVRLAVSAPAGGAVAQAAGALGLACLADPPGAPSGPLAGILAGLTWARDGGADLLATAPCDTPRLPADLVSRLVAAIGCDDGAAVARAPDGLHPLCGVWRVGLVAPLSAALARGVHPPVRALLARVGARFVDFDDASAFTNINTCDDLAHARLDAKAPVEKH